MHRPDNTATYWKRVSTTVNYDGLSEWYRASGCCRKLFWTVVMIGSVVPLVYYTYTVTKQYLGHPSATQLIEQQQSSIPFPTVTICHSARFNRTYIEERINVDAVRVLPAFPAYGTSEQMMKDFIQYLIYTAFQPFFITVEQGTALEYIYQYYFNRTASPFALYNLTTFVTDAALQCSKILTKCAFGAKLFPCCENAKTVWNDYGTCYQIDIVGADSTSAQNVPGSTGGLKVWAAVDREIVPVGGPDSSVALRAHFTTNQVTPCDNPVSVPPNKHALIRIDATQLSLDPMIDGCTNQPPTLLYGVPYSQGSCTNECMQNISLDRCQCKTMGFGLQLDEALVCKPRRMAQCVLPLTIGYTSDTEDMKSLTDQMNCVFNNCPELCQEWVYDTFVSYQDVVPATSWPNSYTAEATVPNGTDSYVFTAFFGEVKYTQVQSAPLWDFNTFICNLGGLLGLWTGLSAITIVQVIVYCYVAPCCYEEGKPTTFKAPNLYGHVKAKKMSGK